LVKFYLVLLIISPQIWWKPIVGLPVDYILYPCWFITLLFSNRLSKVFAFRKIDFIFLGMILWIIFSAFLNDQNSLSIKIIIDYIKFFILFRFLVATVTDFKTFKRVVLFFLFLVFVLVFESIDHKTAVDGLGWVGQPLGWADESVVQTTGSGRTQWVNIFDGPGVFCVLFTMALPFVIQRFDKHYSTFVKSISVAGLALLFLAIYYTGSRGGFLASLVCFFAYIISRSKLTFKQLVFASLLSFLLFMMAPAFLTSTTDSHGSAQNRVEMWKQGFEMTRYNPVFGVGKGNYKRYTGKLIAHNSAIEVMGEIGLPGFFLWISLILLSFKSIRIFYLNTDNLIEKSYSMALAISIIGYIASSMFVTLEYETFYFLLGLAAALGVISGKDIDFTQRDFNIAAGIVFGWILLLKGFFLIY